ncbi:serine/threonine-protein phosphatase [Streptomyces sp. ISL-22]|uniref:PP2C family protein-serine/threonine phosphatase n=1 Tax=unclassified Streptomyces TaxID=2593676 RepID=UPI001BE5930B|nr:MULTISPECIES: PP2C family serine/threonine-protein phosphatase [unclassified Streptomyces]MBT2421201.1 serine/threonine-protein phosphatase [Streptomyces sp. ISL-24]MBT2432844.1 serine/threonine-protein phosphatase [Streptomyces sp. ISL-22]
MPYVAVSAISHPGLLRERNEDSLAVGPWTLCATVTENPQTLIFPLGTPLVVAVADGLGGHPGGDVASALVVRRIAALGPALGSEVAVRDALNACNRAVYQAAGGDRGGELAAMGTTVAGVVVQPDSLLAFNVGDSRVFAASDDGLRQISVDDSPPHPAGSTTSLVTQCLGGSPTYRAVLPHVTAASRAPGERYLICSDGLTDPLPTDVLDDVLRKHDDGRAAFELWKAAIEAGGPDNITLAVVRVGDE